MSTTPTSVQQSEPARIKYSLANVFGLAALAWPLLNAMMNSFWQYFMTDVALIATGVVALVLSISRTLEWVTVIIAGIIMEKVSFKKGKYAPWLLMAPTGVTIFFVLMFINYPLSQMAKAIMLGTFYVLAAFFINFMVITQNTMVALIGKRNQNDRALLSAKRGQGSALGKLIFGVVGLPLVLLFNGGNEAAAPGYVLATLIFGVVMILVFVLLYKMLPEGIDDPAMVEKKDKLSVGQMFKALGKTPPLIAFVLADSMRYIAQFTLIGLNMYIFTYVYDQVALFAVLMTAMNFVSLGAAFLAEILARFMDKRTLYISGLLTMAVFFCAAFLFAHTAIVYVVLICCAYLGSGLANSTNVAVTADAILYNQWKTGKDAKGFLNSIGSYPPKFGNLISGYITGFGLVAIGFVANTEMAAATLTGLKALATILPGVLLVIGVLIMLFGNKLNRKTVAMMNEEVLARNSQ